MGAVPVRPAPPVSPPAPTKPSESGAPLRASPAAGGCRYCGGEFPAGRAITFCPHCGQNVTVIQCPACSAELELGWKYCPTCGRMVADSGE